VSGLAVRKVMDIEALVSWALIDNGLGRAFGMGTKINWMDWGIRPDHASSAAGWGSSMPGVKDADALIVAEAIGQLDPECAQLIIRHGRIGDRPDWIEEGVGSWRQMVDGQGRLMWKWLDPNNRSAKRSKREPRMEFVGETQANVDFYRAQHDVWWIGLRDLVEPLNAVMERHEATGPRAPDRPWLAPATVFGPDGKPLAGMHDRADRRAALQRRGNIQQPDGRPAENVHKGSSAA
jgi:hypothetical protein